MEKPSPARIFTEMLTKPSLVLLHKKYFSRNQSVGTDGTSLAAFLLDLDNQIAIILRKVGHSKYIFTRYKEKLISKGPDSNPRQISIPTIRDKLTLKLVSEMLTRIYPDSAGRPPHETVKKIHAISNGCDSTTYFYRLDICSFYPSIDHKILMRVLRRRIRKVELLRLIETAIATPTGNSKTNKQGVPQGLSISNILASIYFHEIDEKMQQVEDIKYFRYVDDILIIGRKEKLLEISKSLPAYIKSKRKLNCHRLEDGGKTALVSAAEGIDYLGYHFNQQKTEVRQSSIERLFDGLMKIFTAMKHNKSQTKAHIWRLNLRISGCRFDGKKIGWMFFFSQTENKIQLKQLDNFIGTRCKMLLSEEQQLQIKTFIKSFHEIRHNHRNSSYFPDFDEFSDDQMKSEIKLLEPHIAHKTLQNLQGAALRKRFNAAIGREIRELERDMFESLS